MKHEVKSTLSVSIEVVETETGTAAHVTVPKGDPDTADCFELVQMLMGYAAFEMFADLKQNGEAAEQELRTMAKAAQRKLDAMAVAKPRLN